MQYDKTECPLSILKEIVHFHEIIFFAMDLWFFMFKMISKENKTFLQQKIIFYIFDIGRTFQFL